MGTKRNLLRARSCTSTTVLVPLQHIFGVCKRLSRPGCSDNRKGCTWMCLAHIYHHVLAAVGRTGGGQRAGDHTESACHTGGAGAVSGSSITGVGGGGGGGVRPESDSSPACWIETWIETLRQAGQQRGATQVKECGPGMQCLYTAGSSNV